jgi:Phosphotransferase enzyme family
LRLLNQHRTAVPYLVPRSQGASDLSQPVLWHRDLHCGNIFISSTGTITGIIDWQGTAVLPLFLQAKIPQFLEVDSDSLLLELPDQFSSMPELDKTKIWNDYRQSMLQQYYLGSLRSTAPEVAQILDGDPLAAVRRLAATLGQGSFDREADVLLLRELLIRIQRNWTDICSAHSSHPICPVSISHGELSRHRNDGRRWNEFKDFLQSRGIPVAQEGWVPKEEFEMQRDNLRLLLREILMSFRDERERQQFLENVALWDLTDWEGWQTLWKGQVTDQRGKWV